MVRALGMGEDAEAIASLTHAFGRETISNWMFPDPTARRLALRELFTEELAGMPAGGHVDVTEDLGGVAIWHPPAAPPEDPVLPDAATPDQRALFAQIYAALPAAPFWYLAFLGARVGGTGAGSALLEHRLAGLSPSRAALWTGSPGNVGFYERHGFGVVSRHDVPGASGWWLVRD